ncbi:MAG: TonB family protein [Nitrospinota bacterium]|nr:TonB family protein [Nitrospinota bacterium]
MNALLFIMVAYLISQASVPKPKEVISVKMLVLEPLPPPTPPPPIPPKPKPRLVKKIEPRPLPDQPPPPEILEPLEMVPEPKKVGLDENKEPEPEQAPAPSPEPVYIPSHKLSRLPSFLNKVEPVYPETERFTGREARVVVEIMLSHEGKIDSIRIVKSGGEAFDRAVRESLEKSIFSPGYIDQRPVGVRVQIPFVFKLR